jgi:hypothetical protein
MGAMVVSGGITAASPFAVEWPTGESDFSESATATGTGESAPAAANFTGVLSPFASVPAVGYGESEPGGEALELLGEAYHGLYDEAFAEALSDVVNEAAALAAELPIASGEDAGRWAERAEQMLMEQAEPVIRAAEQATEALARELDGRDPARLSEAELDRVFEVYIPGEAGSAPLFEGLFGFLKKAVNVVRNVAAKAGSVVKNVANVALKPILDRLSGLFRPFVQMLMKVAVHRLPGPLRPLALKVGGQVLRALGLHEAGDEAGYPAGGNNAAFGPGEVNGSQERADESMEGQDASLPAEALERGFRAHAAGIIVAPDEATRDALVHGFASLAEQSGVSELASLDDARDRFVGQLAELPEGESVQPALEQFIPVALAAARTGLQFAIKTVGRRRVSEFLSGLLAPVLQRFLQPAQARQLASMLVDIGLKLVTGEAEDAGEGGGTVPLPVARALAQTVEDTVTHLADVSPEAFNDEALLEAETMSAFSRAAAKYLPPQVFKPEERRTHRLNAVFVPRRGARFARYSVIPEVVIPWQVANNILTFRGERLSQFLRDRHGVRPGESVRARMYIWRLHQGARLSDVTTDERTVPGLGSATRGAVERLHPLTGQAAMGLLGEPGLGRNLPARYLSSRGRAMVGQRVYYLRPLGPAGDGAPIPVPYATPAAVAPRTADPARPGRPAVARSFDPGMRASTLRLTLDFRHDEARLYLYLSEPRAQEIARALRQGSGREAVAMAMQAVRSVTGDVLATLRSTGPLGHIRVQREGVDEAEDQLAGGALRAVGDRIMRPLVDRALARIAQLLRTRASEFTAATEDAKHGVTLVAIFDRQPFMGRLRQALSGHLGALAGLRFGDVDPARIELRVLPGYAGE